MVHQYTDRRENNPRVNSPVFHLLPHAPQNKGAKYNAQATDLVASRYLLAEHGRWSVLLFVLLWFIAHVVAGFCFIVVSRFFQPC